MRQLIDALGNIAFILVVIPWWLSGIFRYFFVKGTSRWTFCHRLRQELRPFVLPALVFNATSILMGKDASRWDWLIQTYALCYWSWVWWKERDDDDDNDPWKRRWRKVKQSFKVRTPLPVGAR